MIMSEREFPWTEAGTAALLAANRKYMKSWLSANSRAKIMPDSPKSFRSVLIRMEDGEPALVILRDDGTRETLQLSPAQLQLIVRDGVSLMWGRYDLTERK